MHAYENEEIMTGIPSKDAAPARNMRLCVALLTVLSFATLAHAQQPTQPAQLQDKSQPQADRFTLKEAVARSLQNSHDLALARAQYLATQREVGLDRSRFRPNLYAGSGAAYTSGFPLLAGGGAPAVFSMTYNQSLLDPLARADQHTAEQRSDQQLLAMNSVRDQVIVNVASSYLELAKVRRQLDLLKGERDSAQKILDYTQQRTDAGYELPIEVTKAQLTSARVEQRLAQLEDQDDSISDQLRNQLGLAPDQAIEVSAEDIPATGDQAVSELVNDALRNNLELKQAESQQAATAAQLKGEHGSYFPTISVIGQYNVLTKFNNYTEFFNKFERNNFIAGLEVKIPIFAASTSAAVSLARANLSAAQLTVDNKRTQLSLDVRHQARHVHEMDMAREVARLEMNLSQQSLEVLQAQFQQGRATLRDLEAAQLDQNDKWLAFLDAEFAHQQAQLDLLRTTGQVAQLFQ
jgi:outer membrane protein